MRVTRHKIPAGETIHIETLQEAFIHPLTGYGQVDGAPIGGRRNIFDAFPGGLLTQEGRFTLKAVTNFDVVVAEDDEANYAPKPITVQAKVHMIGDGTARREVREILGYGGPSKRLRCGETINKPGGWSSWPPHHFDTTTIKDFEEVFYVFTDPKDSYALIPRKGRIGLLDVDDVVVAHSGDRVEIPLGSHPIVAAPGTRLIYLWFYVGADKQYAQWSEDLGNYK